MYSLQLIHEKKQRILIQPLSKFIKRKKENVSQQKNKNVKLKDK